MVVRSKTLYRQQRTSVFYTCPESPAVMALYFEILKMYAVIAPLQKRQKHYSFSFYQMVIP